METLEKTHSPIGHSFPLACCAVVELGLSLPTSPIPEDLGLSESSSGSDAMVVLLRTENERREAKSGRLSAAVETCSERG